MSDMLSLLDEGGYVMVALIILSLLLYERCFNMLLLLRLSLRRLAAADFKATPKLADIRYFQDHLRDTFEQNMIRIRAMVSAAPLLGLLGTVIGMIETFTTLSKRSGQQTIQGLSEGISLALVTTETGLAIAIPAVIIVYYAQRQLNEAIWILIDKEETISGGSA